MAKRLTKKTSKAKKASKAVVSGAKKKGARASGASKKKTKVRSTAGKKTPKVATKAKRKSASKASASEKSVKKAAPKSVNKTTSKTVKKAVKAVKKSAARLAKRAPRATETRREAITVQWGNERVELVDRSKKIPKTKLGKRELNQFKKMLLDKRRELVGNMENLGNEAMNSNQSGGRWSSMPLHMADLGTDNWEQEFTLGLIESERSLVHEIDDALRRIENRTYGICLATHRPIDTTRLRAKPWAKYCIEYARLKELGRVP